MDELFAVLAVDVELLAYVHAAALLLLTAGWCLAKATVPFTRAVPVLTGRPATPFARGAGGPACPERTQERGPPPRV